MLTDIIVVIISQYVCVCQIILYANLRNVICQLYRNKAGEKSKLRPGLYQGTIFDSTMSQRLLVFGLEGVESNI